MTGSGTGPGCEIEEVDQTAAALIAALTEEAAGEPWSADAVARILALPGAFALIAHVEGRPAGFILAQVAADESEIVNLVVATYARRRGVGRSLLAAAMGRARERGACAMFLEVASDNEAARALYRDQGFVQVGIRPDYYRRGPVNYTDALVLRRDLITTTRNFD